MPGLGHQLVALHVHLYTLGAHGLICMSSVTAPHLWSEVRDDKNKVLSQGGALLKAQYRPSTLY